MSILIVDRRYGWVSTESCKTLFPINQLFFFIFSHIITTNYELFICMIS